MSSLIPNQDNRAITIEVPQRVELQKLKSTTDLGKPPVETKETNDFPEAVYKTVRLKLNSDQLLHSTVPTAYYEPLESQENRPPKQKKKHDKAAIRSVIKKTGHKPSNSNEKFRTRVSFDTVNLQYSDANILDARSDDEDEYNYISTARNAQLLGGWTDALESSRRGRSLSKASSGGRTSSPLALSPSPSPLRSSPQRRVHSPAPLSRGGPGLFGGFRRDYPTSPIIEHDSCTLTKVHRDWELLYAGKIPNKKPVLPNRVILVYASGRKHTWVAIDWCLRSLLQDGDEVVIVAAVNPNHHIPSRLRSGRKLNKTGPQYIKVVTGNLMKYIISVVNPRKIVKISVELAVGTTKEVLRDMLQLYQPNLAVVSALPNKTSALRSWKSSRLTDRMVKNYPIPTIIVPAANMDDFENILFENLNRIYVKKAKQNVKEVELEDDFYDIQLPASQQLDLAIKNIKKRNPKRLIDPENASVSGEIQDTAEQEKEGTDPNEVNSEYDNEEPQEYDGGINQGTHTQKKLLVRSKSENSPDSESASIYSNSSLEETTNIENMRAVVYETETELAEKLYEIRKDPITRDTFKKLLSTVSTAGYKIGKEMAETARMGGEGAELVRSVTGAPSVGSNVYQTKSMLLSVSPKSTNSTTVGKQNQGPSPPVFKIGSGSPDNHSQLPTITKNGPISLHSTDDKSTESRFKGHRSTKSETGTESSSDKKKSRKFSLRKLWGK